MARLSKEDIVTIGALRKRGRSASAVARVFGVTEGTVRYRERGAASAAVDGRSRPVLRLFGHVARHAVERPDGAVETYEPELTKIQLQVLRLLSVPPSAYTTTR